MSLPMRRAREVYRIYDELEYVSGVEGADLLASSAPGSGARRRGGPAAATVAVLAVGGTSVTLLAMHGSEGPAGKGRLADAPRSAAPDRVGAVASGADVGQRIILEQRRASRAVRPRGTRRAPWRSRVAVRAAHARAVETKRAAGMHAIDATPAVNRPPSATAADVPVRTIPTAAGEPSRARRSEFGFERG
ncbi:MAG: hypothetical protein H0X28_10600 [Solirubrobacterales bacterium]|nr:hypothetical protein [Solirubrobacterales bacterium]